MPLATPADYWGQCTRTAVAKRTVQCPLFCITAYYLTVSCIFSNFNLSSISQSLLHFHLPRTACYPSASVIFLVRNFRAERSWNMFLVSDAKIDSFLELSNSTADSNEARWLQTILSIVPEKQNYYFCNWATQISKAPETISDISILVYRHNDRRSAWVSTVCGLLCVYGSDSPS